MATSPGATPDLDDEGHTLAWQSNDLQGMWVTGYLVEIPNQCGQSVSQIHLPEGK